MDQTPAPSSTSTSRTPRILAPRVFSPARPTTGRAESCSFRAARDCTATECWSEDWASAATVSNRTTCDGRRRRELPCAGFHPRGPNFNQRRAASLLEIPAQSHGLNCLPGTALAPPASPADSRKRPRVGFDGLRHDAVVDKLAFLAALDQSGFLQDLQVV